MAIHEELERLAALKGMRRREFIQRSAALGVGASTASAIFSRAAFAQ